MLTAILRMLRDLVLATLILGAFSVAALSLCLADRWAFRRKHGEAALDRFDAECSRVDDELRGRALAGRRPGRLIPFPTEAERLRRRERGGAA